MAFELRKGNVDHDELGRGVEMAAERCGPKFVRARTETPRHCPNQFINGGAYRARAPIHAGSYKFETDENR